MSKEIVSGFKKSIESLRGSFDQIAKHQTKVKFEMESMFAVQALEGNSFLLRTAQNNPSSLKNSILNIATVGISLNPLKKEAYLVPRNGQVCLDISYRGLVGLATDGGIKLCQAKLVHENDSFAYNGPIEVPLHTFDPFGDRGAIKGVYCFVLTDNGICLVETMSIAECYYIRDRTDIWKKSKSGPWKEFEGEMMKKTVIKRASKLWPKNSERLNKAIEVINEHEGIDFKENKEVYEVNYSNKYETIEEIKNRLNLICKDMDMSEKIDYLSKNFNGATKISNLIGWEQVSLDRKLEWLDKEIETK